MDFEEVKWFKDDKEVLMNELNVQLDNDRKTLIFNQLNHLIHNGNYDCRLVLNNGQIINSLNSINVTVRCIYFIKLFFKRCFVNFKFLNFLNQNKDPPLLKLDLGTNKRFNETDDVKVACDVDGYPFPSVIWKTADNKVVDSVEISSNTFSLMFKNAKRSQNGTYICSANNYLSNIEQKFDLVIQCMYDFDFIHIILKLIILKYLKLSQVNQ